ncbi:MAG: hypothetical protein P8Y27_21265 [Chromatiaceae bacterium]
MPETALPGALDLVAVTWWPSTAQVSHRLSARELQILLWNGNPEDAGMAEDWRRVA